MYELQKKNKINRKKEQQLYEQIKEEESILEKEKQIKGDELFIKSVVDRMDEDALRRKLGIDKKCKPEHSHRHNGNSDENIINNIMNNNSNRNNGIINNNIGNNILHNNNGNISMRADNQNEEPISKFKNKVKKTKTNNYIFAVSNK